MASVYILKSVTRDKFYIGFTTDPPLLRLERHNTDYYQDKYSSFYKPWELFWTLLCENNEQARAIELHIKKMKSKKYNENLVKYPEIGQKLLEKYSKG